MVVKDKSFCARGGISIFSGLILLREEIPGSPH